jgi:hypothetical protein
VPGAVPGSDASAQDAAAVAAETRAAAIAAGLLPPPSQSDGAGAPGIASDSGPSSTDEEARAQQMAADVQAVANDADSALAAVRNEEMAADVQAVADDADFAKK